MKQSVLLMNLGTPDDCDAASVRRYLKQFLNDPRVIDLPFLLRYLLVNVCIIPLRYRKTAAAYQQVWQAHGSPLLINSLQLREELALALGTEYQVEIGMRYGNPSIEMALNKLAPMNMLTVIPLFPQYSSAASGSALQVAFNYFAQMWNIPSLRILTDFYDEPGFISAYVHQIRSTLEHFEFDLLLFSYHGLPERHINKSLCQAACNRNSDCPVVDEKNRFCYRAQCFATTQRIVEGLSLNASQYTVSFQSRLGRTPWIKPYTDQLLKDLIARGVKRLAVVCPSFVADCLETLEEINIRTREQWLKLGGTDFMYVPCLNSQQAWVQALTERIRTHQLS